jgi:uncharacterized protein YbcC (UPF0753/DUF2309 family)
MKSILYAILTLITLNSFAENRESILGKVFGCQLSEETVMELIKFNAAVDNQELNYEEMNTWLSKIVKRAQCLTSIIIRERINSEDIKDRFRFTALRGDEYIDYFFGLCYNINYYEQFEQTDHFYVSALMEESIFYAKHLIDKHGSYSSYIKNQCI